MKILEHGIFDFRPLDGSLSPMGAGRPTGRHLSDIIKRRKEEAGENMNEIPGDQPGIAMQLGFLFERALEYVFREFMQVQRNTQTQLHESADDISGTPDGFDHDADGLEEYKTTMRTMKDWEQDPQNFWTWMEQTKGYLMMLSRRLGRPITRVTFYILWWYGDYSRKPGRGRQITKTVLEFDWEEIEENWRLMLRYDAVMRKEEEGRV